MEKALGIDINIGSPVDGSPESQPHGRIKAEIPQLGPPGLFESEPGGAGINIRLFNGDIIADGVFHASPEIPFILSSSV
jgi:hypothetical protein